jgi:hypothetical protein
LGVKKRPHSTKVFNSVNRLEIVGMKKKQVIPIKPHASKHELFEELLHLLEKRMTLVSRLSNHLTTFIFCQESKRNVKVVFTFNALASSDIPSLPKQICAMFSDFKDDFPFKASVILDIPTSLILFSPRSRDIMEEFIVNTSATLVAPEL